MEPTADRSVWPEKAVELAERYELPDHAVFYRVIDWPNGDSWADLVTFPAVPRGQQTYRWGAFSPTTQGKRWLFAFKSDLAPYVVKAGNDKRDVIASTGTDTTEEAA